MVRVTRRQLRGRVVRRDLVHDVLHEGAAVARRAVPPVRQQIAGLQGVRQIVLVEHVQPVPHPVDALEEEPAGPAGVPIGLAEVGERGGVDLGLALEVGLDHPVGAPGGELGRAPAEHLGHATLPLVGLDPDAVGVNVSLALDVLIHCGQGLEGRHGVLHAGLGQLPAQGLAVALHPIRTGPRRRATRRYGVRPALGLGVSTGEVQCPTTGSAGRKPQCQRPPGPLRDPHAARSSAV